MEEEIKVGGGIIDLLVGDGVGMKSIYIYIKAKDVAIYLSFGMYGNVFCMTHDSLVG